MGYVFAGNFEEVRHPDQVGNRDDCTMHINVSAIGLVEIINTPPMTTKSFAANGEDLSILERRHPNST